MAKSASQILTDIVKDVVANFAPVPVDTRIGTILRDAIIFPMANRLAEAFTNIDTTSTNQSLQAPEALTEVIVDRHGANSGVSRFTGSPSVGTLRLVKFTIPTVNIPIPVGSSVATRRTAIAGARTFSTLSSVELTPLSPADPITGAAAYVDVAIRADESGENGNVDADTVIDLLASITGVDAIFNPAALSGGKSSQTNTEMADVIRARAQGRLGTRTGYKDLIRSNFSVLDVDVIAPGDPGATRDQFGGAVDIIVLSDASVQTIETFAYVNAITTTSLTPTFRPLVRVNTITGIDAGDAPIILEGPAGGVGAGVDYDVTLDDFSPFAGSNAEQSVITLHPTANIPKDGSTLDVTYENNELIRIIQSFLGLEDNAVVGADVLTKAALKINAEVTADIRVIPGFDSTVVQAAAVTAVNAHFDALLLDDDVQASDVTTVIGNVTGVDSVDLDTFKLALASLPAVGVSEIIATKQKFIRASAVTITVV